MAMLTLVARSIHDFTHPRVNRVAAAGHGQILPRVNLCYNLGFTDPLPTREGERPLHRKRTSGALLLVLARDGYISSSSTPSSCTRPRTIAHSRAAFHARTQPLLSVDVGARR
jgi:hypothetical protein